MSAPQGKKISPEGLEPPAWVRKRRKATAKIFRNPLLRFLPLIRSTFYCYSNNDNLTMLLSLYLSKRYPVSINKQCLSYISINANKPQKYSFKPQYLQKSLKIGKKNFHDIIRRIRFTRTTEEQLSKSAPNPLKTRECAIKLSEMATLSNSWW